MRRTTHVRALGVLAIAAAVGVSGCFKGDFATCKVTCATSADCPGGLACNAQGVCSPGGNACSAMPDADLTKPQPLTVTKSGEGDVQSNPAGINCGETCMAEFGSLSSVTLAATPAASSVFEGWTGDCSGTTDTCTLTMDGPKSVQAQFALHGAKRWVKQISFSGQDFGSSELEVDADGNVIAAGIIDDQGSPGFYVVKYAKDTGDIMWDKKVLAAQYFFIVGGLDTDAAGNVYMCARMQGNGMPIMIGNSSVTGDIFGNVLAVRLAAATGDIEWAKAWGGSAQEECEGVAVSGNDVFFTGYTSSNPSNFDGVTLAGSVNNAFVVRAATSNGTAQTGKLLAGNFDVWDIAANAGQIAIAGAFRTNYSIDSCSISLTGTGATDGMLMNFSNNLVCTWAVDYGSLNNNESAVTNAVAAVPGGGWVVTGSFQGSALFASSGSYIPSQGGHDVFVARYQADGAHVWSFGYGSTGFDSGRGVDVTPTGEVVVAGEFSSTITFGSFPLTTTNSDVFITRMSAGTTPIHQWATKIGGTANENVNGLSVDAQGTVSVLANWTGMSDVAGTPLTAQDYDAWVGSFVR